ncbi:MAG TPA: M20/M25/M40 family metallo-hydrolase [Vicinamibacterales bacterium]|nr:M20/M25/M40 family metallo-hydrolase [Vicinamibacterales bacterium]
MTRPLSIGLLLAGVLAGPTVAGWSQQEPVDATMVARIRDEGLNRSQVGGMFTMLVDRIGPRLAGSKEYLRAAEWARDRMTEWGFANVRLEPFDFSRGWTLEQFSIEMVSPRYMPLVGFPEAWSPSTAGPEVSQVVTVAGKSPEEVEAMQGTLKGAAVLQMPAVDNFIRTDRVQPTLEPEPAAAAEAGRGRGDAGRGNQGGRQGGRGQRGAGGTPSPAERIRTAMTNGGATVLLRPSRGEHGTLFVQAGSREIAGDRLPRVVLIGEHYNLLSRLVALGENVQVRVNVQARLLDDPQTHNVIGEIPGVDPKIGAEVVMLGAHLDSWHTAVGATDNADGAAVALEAFRILKSTGIRPRRTLRLALWGAEEQGLLGSRAYVARHLAGDENAEARQRMSVYFNIDPGKGPIYGWFLQGNEAVRPIFDAWLAPFQDLGARSNVIQNIGSTDHLSFINVGVPGFNPVQDYVDYDVREHHTNVDTPERVKIDDLKQNAVILAAFVYHAAMRDAMLPSDIRK